MLKPFFLFIFVAVGAFAQSSSMSEDFIYNYFSNNFTLPEIKRSITRHFRDSDTHLMDPEALKTALIPTPSKVSGTVKYFGMVEKPYRYDVLIEDGVMILRVKIHFKADAEKIAESKFVTKISQAEKIWNHAAFNFKMAFTYKFRFEVVDKAEDAHFSVRIKRNVQGPYDTFWNPKWDFNLVAHEIGHMYGLADEYDEYTRGIKANCDTFSIMCSMDGLPRPYHYYFILRRTID